jgi:hypothetical protein
MSHTPEPWALHEAALKHGNVFITSADDAWLITIGVPATALHIANARRIVACVNACAGIDNERLIEFDLHRSNLKLVDKIMALEQQRDELLAALQDLLSMQDVPDSNCSCHINPPCNDCVNYSGIRESIEFAEKAIAKAQGDKT